MKYFKIYDFKEDGNEPQKVNSVRTVEVDSRRICLVHLPDGYFALDDKCPHAGGRLGLGKCDEHGNVICPIHRYRFNAKTGRGLPGQGDYVNTHPIEIKDDGVYIGFKKKWWQLF